MTLDQAADAFLADRQRLGWQPRSIESYRAAYRLLGDHLDGRQQLGEISADDLRAFLARRPDLESHLASLFGWLLREGRISADPTALLSRRRRGRAEDLDVISISSEEVQRLLDAALSWPERIALGILA